MDLRNLGTEIPLSGWADVACRNTVHELPVGLTSLCIRIRSRAELLSQQFIHDGHGGVHHSEGYFPCGRAVEIVMTPSLLKPGSTARSFLKLARNSPAPISNTHARPPCAECEQRFNKRGEDWVLDNFWREAILERSVATAAAIETCWQLWNTTSKYSSKNFYGPEPDFWVIRHEFEVSQNYYCPTEVFERKFHCFCWSTADK